MRQTGDGSDSPRTIEAAGPQQDVAISPAYPTAPASAQDESIATLREAVLRAEQAAAFEHARAERALAELAQIHASTSWRLTAPMRRLLSANPRLRALSRHGLYRLHAALRLLITKLRGWVRRFSAQAPSEIGAPLPSPSSAKPALAPPAPFDPAPLLAFVHEEYAEARYVRWLSEHAGAYALPFNPEGGAARKVPLDDADAAALAQRTAARAVGLPAEAADPEVSIVIPAYNEIRFTLSAIAAVYAQETTRSYEIIVADDCSTDLTRELERHALPLVRVARTPRNLGFIGNCNHAATDARGRYIVLLNNDTIVLPHWLDELIGTLERDESIGLVGSRLIYPHARLQEAGGIIWRDGSGWNFGRLSDPSRPEFCYAREVDYCSGASIALPMALWRKLGGFDGDTYEVAYYEDADLAFRVRETGLRVVYQPLSTVVHFEGVSSGTDTTQGVKAYQVSNAARFKARWRERLDGHRANGVEPEREKERGITKRMLIIDAITPRIDRDAGSVVAIELNRALQAEGWKLTFIPEDNFARLPETRALQREGVEAIYYPFFSSVEEYLRVYGAMFDSVMIYRVNCAAKHLPAVRRLAPQAKVIFNTVDLHFLREQREAAVAADHAMLKRAERTKHREIAAAAESDLTVVHSSYEADVLAKNAPTAKTYVFPWISEVAGASPNMAVNARRGVVFVGGFRHPPNTDAVHWFVSDVWPLVRAAYDNALFHVIGADAPDDILALHGRNGVNVVGWAPDLSPHLNRARLTVAPLRFGAGVKGKVISSLAHGAPVVGTAIAAEGIGLVNGEHFLLADDPEPFAEAIVTLHRDDALWRRLSSNGIAFIENNFSRARARARVREMSTLLGLADRQS